MKPWVEMSGTFDQTELNYLSTIRAMVKRLPEIDPHPSCHVLARAISQYYPLLRFRDGYFDKAWNHSWLLTPQNNIIDPYPVLMSGGPIMVLGGIAPWLFLYEAGKLPESLDLTAIETQAKHPSDVLSLVVPKSDP